MATCTQYSYFTVGSLTSTLASLEPHGSDYVGGFLCPLPEPLQSDVVVECSTSCPAGGCGTENMQCCPTTPGCHNCIEATATDSGLCVDEAGNRTIIPLTTFLNGEECEFWWAVTITHMAVTCILSSAYIHSICVAGSFYCHALQGNCTQPPSTNVGGNCSYGDRNVRPGELSLISHNGECKTWLVADLLYCRAEMKIVIAVSVAMECCFVEQVKAADLVSWSKALRCLLQLTLLTFIVHGYESSVLFLLEIL